MKYDRAQTPLLTHLRRLLAHAFDRARSADHHGPERADDTRPMTPSPEIRLSAHGDGLVILHIPSGRVFVCNSTGCRIWKGVLKGSSADAVSEDISREFGVAPALAREHTKAFVTKLEQQGLLLRA